MKELITKERLEKGLYWTRALSIVEGCWPVSQGCLHCWAADQAHMRQCQENKKIKKRYQGLIKNYKLQNTNYKQITNPKLQIPKIPEFKGKIRLMEKDLDKPINAHKPKIYLVLNDLFHEKVPKPFIFLTFNTMAYCQDHIFIVLTKRVERMKEYLYNHEWENGETWAETHPSNIIIGTSVEDQKTADERLPVLLSIPAACRVVSFEPLLEKINIRLYKDKIDWAIIGHETGKKRRKGYIDDIYQLRRQFRGIPVFIKAMEINGKLTRKLRDFPPFLQSRQFPSMKFLKRNEAF